MPVDPKSFQKKLQYQSTASAQRLMADLEDIAKIDQFAEQEKARQNKVLIAAFITLFVSIFLTIVLPPLGILLLIGSIVTTVYAGIRLSQLNRIDLANYRYGLVQKLLGMLSRDLPENANLSLKLILDKPTEKRKKLGTVPHPHRQGWKIDQFRDPWLTLRGRLLDGTRFLITATELHQTAHGWKRGSSGKNKYKTKPKTKGSELGLTLIYPRRKYGAIQVLERDAMGAIHLPNGVRLKQWKMTGKALRLGVKTPPDPTASDQGLYNTLTMMFLSLYQILNLARTLSKKK
ncbi:MAG: hypothetical protein KME16_18040 [Scytolyngbya sp. HA4215-MV1]|jgi:hypothetical protein|nr:hypothetical protein [Scytolyngbya sp. HA4215-MV1]